MEAILNNPKIRVVVGLVLGAPLTLIAIFLGCYGLILGYAGIVENKPFWFLAGLLTVSGFVGILGAWWRIIVSTRSITGSRLRTLRLMLFAGAGTSFALAVWALLIQSGVILVLLLFALTLIGTLFIRATPECTNKEG